MSIMPTGQPRASTTGSSLTLRARITSIASATFAVGRIVTLVDSALFGFHLDLATDRPEELARGVDDLARAAEALADLA